MIYQDYMRRKMHNVVKLDTAEGYPLTVYNCANKNLKDYTIYGNTGGVGDKTENVFNYTEPYNDDQIKADEDGWYDVTVNNTSSNAITKNCFTKVNLNLKTNTKYYLVTEVAERTGVIDIRPVNPCATNSSGEQVNLGQFNYAERYHNPEVGIYKKEIISRASFDNCISMLRNSVISSPNTSGHIKFRIAVYEVQKDTFEPYDKYKIPILINDNETAVIFRDAPLADGESINYKSDSLPDIVLEKGTNIITADTEVKPSSIKIKYLKK